MSVRVRIAPSPTGNLHIGTARTALFNWLFARHHGGQFVLRIEDTDTERSKPEFTENILSGLRWLGLDWDEGPFYQTDRMALYQKNIQQLIDKGVVYRSYETAAELEDMRDQQKERNEAPRYDNRHRHLTADQEAAYIAEGRTPVLRFIIDDDREITWQDMVRGQVTWKGKDLGGDMVIARASGQPLYNFVVVIDDIDMAITHVIRGEDHIGNTPKQILLYEALGVSVPQFGHTPLILNQSGAKLSKRDGATSVDDYRNLGYLPQAFNNYMLLLGWSPPDTRELYTLSEVTPFFNFERVNRAGARFDRDKLNWINSQYLHALAPNDLLSLVFPIWQTGGYVNDADREDPWLLKIVELIGTSLIVLQDVMPIADYFFREIPFYTDEAKTVLQNTAPELLTAVAEAVAATSSLSIGEGSELVQTVAKSQGVKKGALLKPLRAALTGDVHGPDLMSSLSLLHEKKRALPRLHHVLQTFAKNSPD